MDVDVFDLDIYQVNNPNDDAVLKSLFSWIGVGYDLDRAKVIVGKKINSLKRYDKRVLIPLDDEVRKRDEREILEKLEEFRTTVDDYAVEFSKDVENFSKEMEL